MKRAAALVLLIFLLAAPIFGADAPAVTLSADRTALEAGQTVTLRLLLQQDVPQRVSGWQWNLIWDSSLFELVSAEVGDAAQGVTPIINTTRVTTSYAAPYTAASITQGNTLTPHKLKKGTLATFTLRAKQELSANAGARFYLDRVIVMDEKGTALAVAETDPALLWGADRTQLPAEGSGLSIALTVPDAPVPDTSEPSTEPETEPTTEPSAEPTTEPETEPGTEAPESSTQPEATQESSTEPSAPSQSTPESSAVPGTPAQPEAPQEPTEESEGAVFYTVIFLSNGGSSVPAQRVEAGALLSEPEEPARDGWRFNGWYQDETLTALWNFSADAVSGDLTLYAGWLPVDGSADADDALSFPLWLLPVLVLLAAAGTGVYFFFGRKKITLDSCGGTPMDPIYVRRDSLLEQPMTPVKPGAVFLGWYTEREAGVQWNFAQRRVKRSVTLYAHWK